MSKPTKPNVHWTPASEDDVEGHRLPVNGQDVEPHRVAEDEDDDVQGHARMMSHETSDDDDVQGHRRV